MAPDLAESTAFQVYQRVPARSVDDAARELTRRQFAVLVTGLEFRAKHLHGAVEHRIAV